VLAFYKEWILWRDRKDGGGMVWRMKKEEFSKHPDRRSDLVWDGNTPAKATKHMNFLCVAYDGANDQLDPDGIGPFFMSFQKTTMKAGRALCAFLASSKFPAYYKVYTVKTRQTKNDKGTFYVADVVPEVGDGSDEAQGWVRSEATKESLQQMYKQLVNSGLRVQMDDLDEELADEGGDPTEPSDDPDAGEVSDY